MKQTIPQRYRQTTVESCLAVALLQLIRLKKGIPITQKRELDLLFAALRYTRQDFVVGHLEWLRKRFGGKWLRIVQFPAYARYIARISGKNTEVKSAIIDGESLERRLEQGPIAVLLDDYVLFRIFHYPHWVVLLRKERNNFVAFEPWDGKIIKISNKKIDVGIRLLRRHLRWSPQAIQLN